VFGVTNRALRPFDRQANKGGAVSILWIILIVVLVLLLLGFFSRGRW
jgi:flagellar basal body-associated protein FliL